MENVNKYVDRKTLLILESNTASDRLDPTLRFNQSGVMLLLKLQNLGQKVKDFFI